MTGFVDIYTLIFLVLAVVIFFKLRSVLGQRTGSERRPFDPFSRRTAANDTDAKGTDAKGADANGGKVVSLPRRDDAAIAATPAPITVADERIAAIAPPDSPLAAGLVAIMAADRTFDPKQFIDGARTAYEMIVSAFARGDRKALKPLLGREVFDGFAAAISEREQRGETVEFNFVGIDKAEITEATQKGGTAQITARFVSKIVSATRNKAGEVVDGDPVHVADVTDIWTFARDVNSRDPNWTLVATETVE
ncbi:Tim44/TimA family putative adaptor protein [Kaistia dalseonensis]|uniref:Lipid-binding transport protein (Tim44 family) n=1 Tax=Kaistia dalseonensis TaxID=410840 RepID=A0ABU0H5X4_9HYPH|nr:Tim44/TimA family putative adaptor protein [Kaistia dalseonensis]MCX5494846.1 Tim44/TimA family putative adaptor protein [Kaistia dalseonensis]MDQ0437427.1 putative lipid-binding transport protein (Tim44 family) [Kaistia dalseonensis]